MEWKLFATLAETAGESEVSVDVAGDGGLEDDAGDVEGDADGGDVEGDAGDGDGGAGGGATVGDALDALLDAHPALADEILTAGRSVDDGGLREHLRLLVDGRDPFREGDGLDEPVDSDAELALFPPVSGG